VENWMNVTNKAYDSYTGPAEKTLQVRFQWQRWVEPWYLANTLLGATTAGAAPILLPLTVNHTGSAIHIGLVMVAFNLGGLTAPLWGSLAHRYRLHRWLMSRGLMVITIGLAAFPFTKTQAACLQTFYGGGQVGSFRILYFHRINTGLTLFTFHPLLDKI
jgi:hypothetical protein